MSGKKLGSGFFPYNSERSVFCHLDNFLAVVLSLSHASHNPDAESHFCGEDDSAALELFDFIFLVPASWLSASPVASCHCYMVRSKMLTPLKLHLGL